jgi:hypothetical protein
VKDIFQRKAFWVILVILLVAVFVYPPFLRERRGFVYSRGWELFFLSHDSVDLKMLLVEAVIAILLSIGICLIPFRKIEMLLGFIGSGIKESETNHEGTGASTYEWVCSKCNYINQMEGYKQEDICSKCGHLVKLNIPGDAKESSKEGPKD